MTAPEPHPADAMLRPSSAHRWMRCAAAPSHEVGMPDDTSEYADEGTAAHSVAEHCLKANLDPQVRLGSELQMGSGRIITVDLEMVREVDKYLKFIRGLPGAHRMVEKRVDLSDYIPNDGTADAVVIDFGERTTVYVNDLKYGKGVRVIAKDNEQLMLYALGVVLNIEMLLDTDDMDTVDVVMTICQPRLDNFDSHTVTAAELLAFGERVRAAVPATRSDDPAFEPGKHCKFCRFKPRCRAHAEYNIKTVADQFADVSNFTMADPAELTPEEAGRLWARVETFKDWIGSLEAYIYDQLNAGVDVPGWKLALGRMGNRTWRDPEEVIKACKRKHWKMDEFAPRKLKSVSELEKQMGDKKKFAAAFDEYIIRSPGRPTLVPADDKRPAVSSASEFEDVSGPEFDPLS